MGKVIEADKGENIYSYIERLLQHAEWSGSAAGGEFNGIDFVVSPRSSAVDIAKIYDLKSELRRYKEGKR